MEAFQQRVVDEKTDLDGKIERLGAFIQGSTYLKLPAAEQERLKTQVHWMKKYTEVLGERIAAFVA
jgi:hypothetical protein